MKVLHVINGESYAGAERVQDLLALGLPAEGFEVGFACVKPGQFAERRQSKATELHLTPMRGRFDLRPGLIIGRLVRNQGYSLVHTHTPRSAMVGRIAALKAGVPMVHHVHSPTSRDTESRLRNWVNVQAETAAMLGVRRLIAVSASLSRHLASAGIDAGRIRVVPNGVPTPGSLPDRQPPTQRWVISSVALFRPRKGLEVLIDALAVLRRHGLDVQLHAVGPFESDHYRRAMEAHAMARGVAPFIQWLGFASDITARLRETDVLVLPSLFGEGMPMVVLEAMAAGIPVVASRVEGTPEVLEQGRCGLLVTPGDPDALAKAIRDLVSGRADWRAIRAAAYQRQSTRFSDRAMCAGVAAVYREILADG
jgi:glycosyltransferase involved in cell wall biosynthesis